MKCPYCLKEIRKTTHVFNTAKRRELIMDNILEETSLETVYRRIKKKGYSMARRTFQRDIKILTESKNLTLEVKIGGKLGTTTFVKKV